MNLVNVFLICLLGYVASDSSVLQIERGIHEFLQTNVKPDYVQNAIFNLFKIKGKSPSNKAICSTCVLIANALLKQRRDGASREKMHELSKNLCLWFYPNKETLCRGYTDLELDAALYAVDNKPNITAEHICGIRLQEYDCSDPEYDPWSINIPPKVVESEPPIINNYTGKEYIVHLTDLHYDPLYEPGSKTDCDAFICCQSTNGKAEDPKKGAGYWGEYNSCDNPWHSVQNLFKQILKQHPKIDRVYYTGDMVSHQVWASSIEANSKSIRKTLEELKNTFKSVPIYPVLGNHEAHPSDLYAPSNITDPKLSSQWLLDLVAEEWTKWLPNDTQTTIRKGGYYTVLVKSGFRIIGLNSNLCYVNNLWLLLDNKDPHNQFQWLVDTLVEAEKNREIVHIVSHIPPGDRAALKQCNHEFRRIVDRFSNTIAGQFNGHTHKDELKIFYGLQNPNHVMGVAFTGGSFTSFLGVNPSYKVYEVESSSWRVHDYEQWTYNLQEANESPDEDPKWYKLYSFKEAYGLSELVPSAYHEILQKMFSNSSFIELYRRFQVRDSPVLLKEPCDKECLVDIFCSISGVEYEDSMQCKAFRAKSYRI